MYLIENLLRADNYIPFFADNRKATGQSSSKHF